MKRTTFKSRSVEPHRSYKDYLDEACRKDPEIKNFIPKPRKNKWQTEEATT